MDTIVPNNPYVGPRSIRTGEPFFGRDREIRSLAALLISERIVMLHSPSGAGKSSLIQAGLVPRMKERFSVFPLVRVNLDPPEEVREVAGLNRYVFSTLLSLEEGLQPEKRLPIQELATLTLDSYLEKRILPDAALENTLLLFDQFEEILTVSPTDAPAKQDFFEQLGEALQNRRRWALFAIREDYMGGLAPYVRAIPNRLSVTFRLGLLGPEAAKTAIQQPARNKDVDFTDEAAAKLVDDLRRIQVQQPDGSFVTEEGPSVEPVQLQVVCFNLWQSHAADDKIIDEHDLQRVGSVDQALASYYANAVRTVAESAKTDERLLRQWFDEHLITPEGIRSQVLKGAESTAGLPNIVLRLLENTHLIRGETRAGKTWFELSHDRLVRPVRQDNTAWFEKHLSLLQRQSVLWEQQGRPDGMLLRGKTLEDAEQNLDITTLLSNERDFLESCRKLREQEKRERRRNVLMTLFAIGTTIATIIAGMMWISAQQNATKAINAESTANANAFEALVEKTKADTLRQLAEQQKQSARSGDLAGLSSSEKDKNYSLSLLFSIEAFRLLDSNKTENSMMNALQAPSGLVHVLNSPADRTYGLAFSPDGKMLALGGTDTKVTLWDVLNLDKPRKISELLGNTDSIWDVTFSPNGKMIASNSSDSKIILWDITNPSQAEKITVIDNNVSTNRDMWGTWGVSGGPIKFSPNGNLLAATNNSLVTALWNVKDPKKPTLIFATDGSGAAFSPNGRLLAIGTVNNLGMHNDCNVLLLDISNPLQISRVNCLSESFQNNTSWVSGLGFDSTGNLLLVSTPENKATLWQVADPTNPQVIKNIVGSAYLLEPYNRVMETVDDSGTLWDISSTAKDNGEPQKIRTGIWGSVLRQDGILLSSITNDLAFYNINNYSGPIQTVLPTNLGFSVSKLKVNYPKKIMGACNCGNNGIITFWDVSQNLKPQKIAELNTGAKWVLDFDFNISGTTLISAQDNGTTLWDISNPTSPRLISNLSDQAGVDYVKFISNSETFATRIQNDLSFWDVSDISTPFKLSTFDLLNNDEKKNDNLYIATQTFSPNGKLIVAAGSDGSIYVWNIENLKNPNLLNLLSGSKDKSKEINTIAFSKDGQILMLGRSNREIELWNIANPNKLQFLSTIIADNSVLGIDVNMDGKRIAGYYNGYDKSEIYMWDISNPLIAVQIGNLSNTRLASNIVFGPDGKTILSSKDDKMLSIWNLDSSTWIDIACFIVGRNFTMTEWAQYFPDEPYRATCPQWPLEAEATPTLSLTP